VCCWKTFKSSGGCTKQARGVALTRRARKVRPRCGAETTCAPRGSRCLSRYELAVGAFRAKIGAVANCRLRIGTKTCDVWHKYLVGYVTAPALIWVAQNGSSASFGSPGAARLLDWQCQVADVTSPRNIREYSNHDAERHGGGASGGERLFRTALKQGFGGTNMTTIDFEVRMDRPEQRGDTNEGRPGRRGRRGSVRATTRSIWRA